MEPVTTLPQRRTRDDDVDYSKCLLCQTVVKKESLRNGTENGIQRVGEALRERSKYNDLANIEILDNLSATNLRDNLHQIKWHKNCYSKFTNPDHLRRLKTRFESRFSSGMSTPLVCEERLSRSRVAPVDWNNCMFCQSTKDDKLHNVQTLQTSAKILRLAMMDSTMRCRLAGVNDIVADEGKYHLMCYQMFLRANQKKADDNEGYDVSDICFLNLVDEVRSGLARGGIYSLSSIWQRYSELLLSMDIDAGTYRSNRFKEKLQHVLADSVDFVAPLNKNESLLVFPRGRFPQVLQDFVDGNESKDTVIPQASFKPADLDTELLSWLFRVAVKIRADIKDAPTHNIIGGIDISHAENVVPESLYLFLSLLCSNDEIDPILDRKAEEQHHKILSTAQDVICLASHGKHVTPKHLGIGLAVHQATRSKDLVQLLHAAGNSVSYEAVLRADTAIANDLVSQYHDRGDVIIPRDFTTTNLPGYIRFANDNFDVNPETLDGKNSFHASQTVAYRRRTPSEETVKLETPRGLLKSLKVPDTLLCLKSADTIDVKVAPVFHSTITADMFIPDEQLVIEAEAKDMAWVVCRLGDKVTIPLWSGFNSKTGSAEPETTIVSSLPIINAPAHDFDTIWTVMQRCLDMTRSLGQHYTVITFDEQLYCKAKLLQWNNSHHLESAVIMLGGFHTQLNFAKAIGQHMASSGLEDIWIESGVFGINTSENIMKGKMWNRVFRAHKLTFEALWITLWPKFLTWANESDNDMDTELIQRLSDQVTDGLQVQTDMQAVVGDLEELNTKCEELSKLVRKFDNDNSENPTLLFWRQYMELVSILLRFTRAVRVGDWHLYLSTFAEMLPWFAVYDHTNYTRWGSVFLADMMELETTAPEVYTGFLQGDFVVKETEHMFNQIPDDQGLEHCNKLGKVAGGLIGITQSDGALHRWSLTFNERVKLAMNTHKLFSVEQEDDESEFSHKECGNSRMQRDRHDVQQIVQQLQRFHIFEYQTDLIQIATGDVATEDIKADILSAEQKGKEMITSLVRTRLIDKEIGFHDVLKKKNSKTMASLYKTETHKSKPAANVKADRDLFRRLITSMDAGREVNIGNILYQELCAVPLSLTNADGTLRKTNKSQLMDILTKDVSQTEIPTNADLKTCTVIDGMALIQAVGKPANATTFGDLAGIFLNCVRSQGRGSSRLDIVFDRYEKNSIKSGTRDHRCSSVKTIRRLISDRDVRIPSNWKGFISLAENKANLASFLSEVLVTEDFGDREIVISGGFEETTTTYSNIDRDITCLSANHEEADSRIILHVADAKKQGYERTIIYCKDTDVLIMLIAYSRYLTDEIWMKAGTAKSPRMIRVHDVELAEDLRSGLVAFHSISGTDTTSQFAGIAKVSAWKVYVANPKLLHGLGVNQLPGPDVLSAVEEFVCKLYDPATSYTSIQELRCSLFLKCKTNIDYLPPTKDALIQHIKRAHYQTLVWKQCMVANQSLPSPLICGWYMNENNMKPLLMTMKPNPSNSSEVKTCGCKEEGLQCRTRGCKCTKNHVCCTSACGCNRQNWCLNPYNSVTISQEM